MVDIKKVKLDWKTRLYFTLVYIMLGINSFNLIFDKFIQIFVTVEIFGLNNTTSNIFDWYS